jgi:O-antigen/teichoic acid export membrane protein
MYKKIFKHGSAYFLVSLLTKFTGFLLLPIITRYLTLDEYGLYTNIQTAQQILYLFGTLSLDAAYGRFVYDYNMSTKRLRLLTSTIFTFFVVWNVFYIVLSVVALYFLIDSWGYQELLIAFLVPFIVLFQQFVALNTSLMQSRHHTKKLLSITVSGYFTMQALMVFMLIYLDMGVHSFFISQFIVGFIVMLVHLSLMKKEGILKLFVFNKKTFKKNIRYGFGYMPASLSSWLFMMSDRYIITYFVSLAMAGKYAFIVQITMMIQVIMQSIQTAQNPIFMKQIKENSEESLGQIRNFITVMVFVLLSIYLIMVTLLPFIIEFLFPQNYRGDYLLIPILAMGALFLAIRKMFSNVLVYYKKAFWISISGYVPAGVNLGLNFIFIPMHGIYAAAWTTLFSLFLYALIVFTMAQKLQKFEFDYIKIFLLFVLAIGFTVISFYYNSLVVNFLLLGIFASFGQIFGIYKLLRS